MSNQLDFRPSRSIGRRLALLLVLLAVTFGSLIGSWMAHESRQVERAHVRELESKSLLLDSFLLTHADGARRMALDYGRWDEMARFARTGDLRWAEENIRPALETFRVSSVWVFDRQGRLRYRTGQSGTVPPGLPPGRQIVEAVLNEPSRLLRFFVVSSGSPLEVYGAPIVRSVDSKRAGPFYGVILTGFAWTGSCSLSWRACCRRTRPCPIRFRPGKLIPLSKRIPRSVLSGIFPGGTDARSRR